MTPKSDQANLSATKSDAATPSRQSFIDTLASVSCAPVQRANATHSDARHSSEGNSNDSTHNQDQNSNSISLQSKKNQETASKAQQGESPSHSPQRTDSKMDQSADKTASEKSSASTDARKSDRSASKKAAFTAQLATSFQLQDSTAQPELNGMLSASATGADGQASNADSSEQSTEAQFVDAVSDQGADLQVQPASVKATVFSDVQDWQPTRVMDAVQSSNASKLAQSAAGEAETQSASLDPVSQLKGQATAAVLQSNLDAAGGASSASALDLTSLSQASMTAANQKGSAVRPGDGNPNQSTAKAIQSKLSAAASGKSPLATDASKTAKTDDAHNDSSSAHSADAATIQDLSASTNGAHASSVAVNGSDPGSLQPVIVATQAEMRGTAESHTTTNSIETTAYRAGESDASASEQLTGSQLVGMSGINAARLIQTMSASEMRVGMHSSEFGDISIRTSVSQQQIQAQISVDHNELGNALSTHIPNMQAKLGNEYGLHATIEVSQSGASFSSDGDRSQQHQQKTTVRPIDAIEGPSTMQNEKIGLTMSAVTRNESRLDIRA